MRTFFTKLRLPAIISALLVLPFAILEVINSPSAAADFPFPLFVALWLLLVTFILMLLPIVRSVRVESPLRVTLYRHLPRIALMIILAGLWVGLVLDQMPCFLGVPNCD
jgi:hypothetical protein